MVLQATPARSCLYTDCKSNLAIVARGREWATSAKRANARTWAAIFMALDDDPDAASASNGCQPTSPEGR